MNDHTLVTEAELNTRSVAPRVSADMLEENIMCVNYLNVGKAIAQANQPDHESHHLLTICVLVLKNGFTVVGESACASPENYQQDIGNRIAFEDAKKKVWPLMGYALREQLALEAQVAKFDHDGDGKVGGSRPKAEAQ